jgi:hypothetical protein
MLKGLWAKKEAKKIMKEEIWEQALSKDILMD